MDHRVKAYHAAQAKAELANLGFVTAGLIADRRKLEREGIL